MKISDLATLSVKNLSRRKGRTALTVVGVVVGTCAVIVMISLGIAMSRSNEEMIASFGDLTQIDVMMGYSNTSGQLKLDDATAQQLLQMDHVVGVTPIYNSYGVVGQVLAEKNRRYAADFGLMTGVYTDSMEKMGFALESGVWPTPGQDYGGRDKIPVVVCTQTAYQFRDTRKNPNSQKAMRYMGQLDAAGNQVAPFFDIQNTTLTLELSNGAENPKTKEYTLVVVGVAAYDDSKYQTGSSIFLRMEDMKKLIKAYNTMTNSRESTTEYNDLYVKVDDVDHVDAVDAAIVEKGYSTFSMSSIRKSMQQQVLQSQMILGGLAAISLLVAALNIANTMTMAIYERTREIGVMKVLGCELGHIRAMFLIESGCIGLLGGLVGSVVSLLISFVLNHISVLMMLLGGSGGDMGSFMMSLGGYGGSSTISIVPPWLVLAALVFATCIGLLSGIAPAGKAVKISALEAIRHD